MRDTRMRAAALALCLAGSLACGWSQEPFSSGMAPGGVATMKITVGSRTFVAAIYDSPTARAFLQMLPMTVAMSELNGREKFRRLPRALPSDSTERPATIEAGELMCWSSDCLVLFYRGFRNSYGGYVRLGRILDAEGLETALGVGEATVTFSLE